MDSTRTALRFINVGHLLDHLFMLIYPTAVLAMTAEFGLGYAQMIGLSLGGFIAFGVFDDAHRPADVKSALRELSALEPWGPRRLQGGMREGRK